MIDTDSLLIEDERILGRYTVALLQETHPGEWSPLPMPMDAITTNFRLILRPLRKKYRPASLPARYLRSCYMMLQGNYRCIGLALSTGDWLYLMLSTGKLDHLHDDLQALKLPPPRFHFDNSVARDDIERLITFFGKSPRPNAMPM